MFKNNIASVIFLISLLAIPVYSAELAPKEIAKNAFPAFVTISTFDSFQNPIAIGSGFFISPQNIVTNLHVISGASFINARLSEQNKSFNITGIIDSDEKKDLVLLKTDKSNASFLPLGNSDSISVGEKIYALGNPQGLEGTFSEGIISSIRKAVQLIQITAPISPGSSGGPIINTSGEVVGIAVSYLKTGQNLNFAVPVNELKGLITSGTNKMSKSFNVQKDLSEQVSSIKITEDLTVTDHWFFVGFKNDQFKSSFVKSDTKLLRQGQLFGIRVLFKTNRPKIHTKLVLSVPDHAENFPYHSKTAKVQFSPDHKTVTVENDVFGELGSNAIYWGTDEKDPIGKYSLKLFIEGTLIESKDFEVISSMAPPKIELPQPDKNSENRISIEDVRAKAGVCLSSPLEDNPFSYLKAFGNMLLYARLAREENQNAMTGKVDQSIRHLDKAKQFFACAMLQIIEYRDSKDQNVSLSSNAVANSLNDLFSINGLLQAQFKEALNGKSMPRGDMADFASKIGLASDTAWKELLPAGLIVTHSLVDQKQQGFLNITKKQKEDLISILEKSVKKSYKKDNRALEVTVKYLTEFFKQSWKFKS